MHPKIFPHVSERFRVVARDGRVVGANISRAEYLNLRSDTCRVATWATVFSTVSVRKKFSTERARSWNVVKRNGRVRDDKSVHNALVTLTLVSSMNFETLVINEGGRESAHILFVMLFANMIHSFSLDVWCFNENSALPAVNKLA